MACIEIYSQWQVKPGRLEEFRRVAAALVQRALDQNPGTTRCDWFVHAQRDAAISLATHQHADALAAHVAACGSFYGQLTQLATPALQWVGRPPAAALQALPLPAAIADFDSGLQSSSGAERFDRATRNGPTPHIEIYTRFQIQPGKLAEFKRHARECLDIVIARDPGTSRYDWFYDESQNLCLALDTYDDPPAMFAHMKNCHDAHAKLLQISTMTTEFLGELPSEAYAAIRKYDPYVVEFIAGLKPYSSGGFR